MKAFEFSGVGRIIFGRGKFAVAGEIAASLGRSALVIYNGNGVVDDIIELLSRQGVTAALVRQRGEPTVAQVDAAVEEGRRRNCDSVIGVGGGSAIDAAKAVAGLLTNGGSAVDYMEVVGKGKRIKILAAPWMAIPTTAGTGAEATRNAVIGLPERQFKASIRSELLLPRVALVDPSLGVTVSPALTASSGMDALCQLIESYTSSGASPMTDALALPGIGMAARNLPLAFHDGSDLDAREGMALAALLSGVTLTNAGLGAVHGFAAVLGANFPAPHGTVCAALLPLVIESNVRTLREQESAAGLPGLRRYAEVGRQLPGLESATDANAIDGCVRFTFNLLRELKIPALKQFGIRPARVGEMVRLARKASSMRFNPVSLSDESLSSILGAAIEGDAEIRSM
ncbi:MAG: iron-containing alcohol dehydrogenase [Tepidisphaeraceae bacterium]